MASVKKTFGLFLMGIIMVFMAGCSSDEPEVRSISIGDYTLDSNNKLVFELKINIALDKDLENPTSGLVELISTESGDVFKTI